MLRASPSPMPETRDSNGVDAVLTSTPTALTQSSTTVLFTEIVLILAHADRSGINFDQLGERVLKPPGDRDRAAQGHVEVRQLLRAKSRGGVDRGPGLRDDYLGQLKLGVEPNELRTEPVGVTRGGAVPDRDQFHPMLLGKPRQLSKRLVPTTLRLMRVDCRRRGDLPRPADHGDFDAGPIARIEPDRRARARGSREQQVAQVPGENLNSGIFGSLPEPKAQVAFDVNQDPRPPGQAHRIKQPAVTGPTLIGDLELVRDLPLKDARLASIQHGRVRHELQSEHFLLLAAEQRKGAVRRQFSERLAELEIIGELGAGLCLACTNARTETAARPHFLAQGPDQRGIFGEAFYEDRAGAFESSGGINHSLTRIDILASQLLRALIGPGEKRLCQRLEAGFAGDLSFRPPLRPIGQIEILEPRLAVRLVDRMLKRGVEFSLLTDAVEDGGATLVQLAQIPQPLFERT